MVGVGEGKKAHGFALGLCDSEKMMRKDAEGFPEFGETHDDNLVFGNIGGKVFNVCNLTDAIDKRTVLNELHKDGCILIDGQSGRFVASNYFVGDVSDFISPLSRISHLWLFLSLPSLVSLFSISLVFRSHSLPPSSPPLCVCTI